MTTRPLRSLAALTMASLLLLGALPADGASVVATPPQYQVSPNPNQCIISNPGSKDIVVPRVELVAQSGTAVASETDLFIVAGGIRVVDGSGSGITYCRAVGVSKRKIRLTHCVRPTTGSPCTAVTTGE